MLRPPSFHQPGPTDALQKRLHQKNRVLRGGMLVTCSGNSLALLTNHPTPTPGAVCGVVRQNARYMPRFQNRCNTGCNTAILACRHSTVEVCAAACAAACAGQVERRQLAALQFLAGASVLAFLLLHLVERPHLLTDEAHQKSNHEITIMSETAATDRHRESLSLPSTPRTKVETAPCRPPARIRAVASEPPPLRILG